MQNQETQQGPPFIGRGRTLEHALDNAAKKAVLENPENVGPELPVSFSVKLANPHVSEYIAAIGGSGSG